MAESWTDVAQRAMAGLGVEAGEPVLVHDGAGCQLQLALGGRPWLADDSEIGPEDCQREAQVVMNLPSGANYTTVLEGETNGRLCLLGSGDGGR